MKRLLYPIFLFALIITSACKNDIDLNDEWKERMVCYGLLNPADTSHYVRIEKAFLGDGNALTMAALEDSIFYNPADIEVRIERWNNGAQLNNYLLVPDTLIHRDSGIFANPHQVLYKGVFFIPQDNSSYKLFVKNLRTGKEISSETPIVQDFAITHPYPSSSMDFTDSLPQTLSFITPANGRRYSAILRFHFTERFIYDTSQVSYEYADWNIGDISSTRTNGGEQVTLPFSGSNFFTFVGSNVHYNPLVERIAGKVEFIITCGADDLNTYIQVQQAMQAAATDIPPFTNINGGYGLFSSGYTKKSGAYSVNNLTVNELRINPATAALNFIR